MNQEQSFDHEKSLNNLNFTFKDVHSDYEVSIGGYNEIREFLKNELSFWKSLKIDSVPKQIQIIINQFNNSLNQFKNFLNNSESYDEASFQSNWNGVNNQLKNKLNNNIEIFFSKTPKAKFLKELLETNYIQGVSALRYFSNETFQSANLEHINGIIKAYEFDHQDYSNIIKRRKSEKLSLTDIRNKWEEKTNQLDQNFIKQTDELIDWKDTFIENHTQWLHNQNESYDKFITDKNRELNELKDTYEEKISLEGPVKYWKERAKSYRKKGRWWLGGLIATTGTVVAILWKVLYNMPDAFHMNLFQGDPQAIKGILILATIVSFGAYSARVFARLTFSSFHLERDAEEREQLTLIYLSLFNKEAVDKDDRSTVLQSLFSRAEIGIIGQESSPAMPGVGRLIDKITGDK